MTGNWQWDEKFRDLWRTGHQTWRAFLVEVAPGVSPTVGSHYPASDVFNKS